MDTTPATPVAVPLVSREHIVITPGICGGKPRVDGSRITVANIVVWYERMGLSADEIVSRWPSLTLADIHAALAYYHDHRAAIDERMAEDERFVEDLKQSQLSSRPTTANDTP